MDDIKYVEEAEETVATDAERMAAEKALVRKVDLYLLPCVWIMYLLSYMDVCRPVLTSNITHQMLILVTENQHRQR